MDARFREPKLRPWEIGNWAATLGERYMEVQGYIYIYIGYIGYTLRCLKIAIEHMAILTYMKNAHGPVFT